MPPPSMLMRAIALTLLSSLPGCSESGEASVLRRARGSVVESSGGTVALGLKSRSSYRRVSVVAPGTVAGTIRAHAPVPDSTVAVGREAKLCGDSAIVRESVSSAGTLANALVWVDGIKSGKPLPEQRRETLLIERCRFEPRVLAVASRSTINVFSRDRSIHEARFYREGENQPVEHIQTVDAGQVVPSERIASAPGIIEARCSQHPWARAYIAVFDHPYYAVSDAQGGFKIDGLPAGTYTVKVWHERLGAPVQQRVVVAPGGTANLDVALALQ